MSETRKIGKRAAARLARQYVAELISGQDTPEWLFDVAGVDEDDERSQNLFMEAIEALAARLKSGARLPTPSPQ